MRTGRIVLYGLLGSLATVWVVSCQGPQEFFRDNALSSGSGGAPGTGGALTGSGGSGTGGVTATGGTPATGGVTGTGGLVTTGGVTGTGGIVATGGVTGTGGRATGGVTGTGGIVATGGVTGTGGIVATGGVTGTGGIVATGGVTGTGGLPGTGGAAGSSGAKNCVDAIKLAGYSAGGQMCSACKENGADKSTNCMKVIDCLDTNYPCGSANNCALQCNNSGGADSIVSACVTSLLSAAACM